MSGHGAQRNPAEPKAGFRGRGGSLGGRSGGANGSGLGHGGGRGSESYGDLTQQPTLERTRDFGKFDSGESKSDASCWGRLVFTPPNAHPDFNLVESLCNFGRRNGCHIRLDHPAISGVHCKV